MKPNSNKLLSLMFSLAIVAGCGGSGSDDSTDGGTNSSDAIVNSDGTGSTGDPDSTNNTGTTDNSDSTNTDPVDSNGMATSDTSNAVCGGIASEISYEIFDSAGGLGVYVPSQAPGNIGWDGSSYCDLTSSQDVEEITLLIPYVQAAPTIDGRFAYGDGEWAAAAVASWSNEKSDVALIRNLLSGSELGYVDGARPADWTMMHDGTYLYINVLVRNDGISGAGNVQVFLDSDDPRDDDSIDIFIDGDNSKGTEYDNANDFHTTLAYLDSTWMPEPGMQSAGGLDLSFRTNVTSDVTLYPHTYEIKINLSTAGIEVGVPFGFDIQLNEDDNGGARDARFAWHESAGSALAETSPSVFATLVLTGCADNSNCDLVQNLYGR